MFKLKSKLTIEIKPLTDVVFTSVKDEFYFSNFKNS